MTTEQRIQKRFNEGCTKYNLLEDGDRILVAVSGGKDSLELLRLLSARAKIYRPQIHIEAAHVIMDNIPYETDNKYLDEFCQRCETELHILHTRFDGNADKTYNSTNHRHKTKCFLCSWNRRKTLFEFARDNHFNKVALGHHMDDFLTTLLMNMTYEGSLETMKPTMQLKHYPITLIRPLCLVDESDIREVAESSGFQKQKAVCPYEETTQRDVMNRLLHQIEGHNPEARYSIWHALQGKWSNL